MRAGTEKAERHHGLYLFNYLLHTIIDFIRSFLHTSGVINHLKKQRAQRDPALGPAGSSRQDSDKTHSERMTVPSRDTPEAGVTLPKLLGAGHLVSAALHSSLCGGKQTQVLCVQTGGVPLQVHSFLCSGYRGTRIGNFPISVAKPGENLIFRAQVGADFSANEVSSFFPPLLMEIS